MYAVNAFHLCRRLQNTHSKNWVTRCYMFRDAVGPRVVDVINTFEINMLPQGKDGNYFLPKYCLFLLEVSGRRHTFHAVCGRG
jgi:hypothetical protein